MKVRMSRISLVVFPLLFASGCASTGTDRQEDAVESLDELISEFEALVKQVDKTTGALDGVVAAKDRDMLPPYEFYCAALDDLDDQGEAIVAQAQDLREKKTAYIKGWEKQMQKVTNEEILTTLQGLGVDVSECLSGGKSTWKQGSVKTLAGRRRLKKRTPSAGKSAWPRPGCLASAAFRSSSESDSAPHSSRPASGLAHASQPDL